MSGERFKTNPFLEGMIIPVKGRQVRLSKLGKDDNVLINQATGEVHGTHVTTYKAVDNEQFVKLFTANIAMTFDLQSAGISASNSSQLISLVQQYYPTARKAACLAE